MSQTNVELPIAVNIPPALTLTVTREQFVQLALANRDLQLERTATGELIVMPPTGSDTELQLLVEFNEPQSLRGRSR